MGDVVVADVKEWPILFSGEMVRAVLDGRKTQTRRVMKVQPERTPAVELTPGGHVWAIWPSDKINPDHPEHTERFCAFPYGVPGDRLWVREAWWQDQSGGLWGYRADGIEWPPSNCGGRGMSPYHMPRAFSRLTLKVVSVRVERVQDMSDDDAIAEGMPAEFSTHEYQGLWDSINGKRAPWASNPWVWVVEFKRVTA